MANLIKAIDAELKAKNLTEADLLAQIEVREGKPLLVYSQEMFFVK
jgi:hypothetical protein